MRTLLSIFVLLMVWWMKGGSTTETLRQAQGDKLGNRANVETVADRGNRRDACSTGWTQAEACDYRRRQRWQAARLLYNRCGNGGTKGQQARRLFNQEFDRGVNGRDARSMTGKQRGYRADVYR